MFIPTKLKTITKCAATESTRYAIDGVCLSREADGKCRACCTDGRRLLEIRWDDTEKHDEPPPPFQVAVPRELWELALTVPSPREEFVSFHETLAVDKSAPILVFTRRASEIRGKALDSKFPPTDEVIPAYKPDEGATAGYDPMLLAEMMEALVAIVAEDSYAVRFQIVDSERPALITLKRGPMSAIGVLMPKRIEL